MLFAPAGDARISDDPPGDVAAVAAVALTNDGHDGATYVLTGPEAHHLHQGGRRPVRRDSAAPWATPASRRRPPGRALLAAGLPAFVVEQLLEVFAALRGGAQAETAPTRCSG